LMRSGGCTNGSTGRRRGATKLSCGSGGATSTREILDSGGGDEGQASD
jgi:hypothetical protein